jgi:hypothetical protein
MFTGKFWAGFAVALAVSFGFFLWIEARREDNIIFPAKTFFAFKDYVTFAGSIVGEGRATMNGTVTGSCERSTNLCRLYSLDQIGPNQVSPISPDTLNIRQWDEKILRADTKGTDPEQCNYYEITIYFPNEDISYTRYPQKKDGFCKPFEHKVFNWKIDDSYWWQKMEAQREDKKQ